MENASKALIIAGAILISILVISLGVLVFNNARTTVSNKNLNSQDAKAQNQQFEDYFGTDIQPSQCKELLSTIRTNNLTASREGKSQIVGVCYIDKNGKATPDGSGTSSGGSVFTNGKVNGKYFSTLNFTADVQSITNAISNGTSYTINVPNSKAYPNDKEGKTGFEKTTGTGAASTAVYAATTADDDSDYVTQTGKSGGYYSSGYIRLIYIIDNANNKSTN